MRALIVEDEPTLRQQLADGLREVGYAIDEAEDGEVGLHMATTMPVDLAIVDLGLPKIDGVSLIEQTRKAGHSYPILVLTARDSWQDKVDGLEAGADDYLTKPFHMEELQARLRALLRRTSGFTESVLRFDPLTIDTRSQQVEVSGNKVDLTAYEYRLLAYLSINAGDVISKAVLLDHLYEEDTYRDPNVLEVFVKRLRQKLDPDKTLKPIETLRGRGYRLALNRSS